MDATQDKGKSVLNISENWATQSKQLKQEFPQLTDADLIFEPGKEEELLGRVSTRLDKSREEVINILTKEDTATQNTPE